MPFTQTDIDTLKAAIASGRGARSVTFGDQSVTFNSISEMLALLARMEQEVRGAAANPTPRTRYASTSKGV